ncbi:MAG: tRNA uridine-5-carboxymethylaminomethyl(34) synthesis GTPase MnmE [Candidatus Babeliales bacterium]
MYTHDNQTIIAQCTPSGSGALALLRMCGDDALTIASRMSRLSSGKSLTELPTHTIHYGKVINEQGTIIDSVMFLLMHGPKTFTGQHTVEITCHNNPFIINDIIASAISCGARLAQEGEFTRRAVMNKKIDLVQAEAINELIHANTAQALKKSLAQLDGSFSHWIQQIEQELIKALAFSESSFEFIDEEMEFGNQIKASVDTIITTIHMLKKAFNQQQQIRQGVRIALIGSVNAGKSSLFNALLHKERSIVTNIAGTTRDVIEAGLYKSNSYWTLIDTAGLRATDDTIEQEGIARSLQEAALADIIILIVDSTRSMTHEEHTIYNDIIAQHQQKIIIVHNKIDMRMPDQLPLAATCTTLEVSSTQRINLELLENHIEEKIAHLFAQADAPFLLNKRQYTLLLALEKALGDIQQMLHTQHIAYELLSYHLQEALTHLTELTGKTISEQGMDAVFREFCVGK